VSPRAVEGTAAADEWAKMVRRFIFSQRVREQSHSLQPPTGSEDWLGRNCPSQVQIVRASDCLNAPGCIEAPAPEMNPKTHAPRMAAVPLSASLRADTHIPHAGRRFHCDPFSGRRYLPSVCCVGGCARRVFVRRLRSYFVKRAPGKYPVAKLTHLVPALPVKNQGARPLLTLFRQRHGCRSLRRRLRMQPDLSVTGLECYSLR
jgi:hypothetical protein